MTCQLLPPEIGSLDALLPNQLSSSSRQAVDLMTAQIHDTFRGLYIMRTFPNPERNRRWDHVRSLFPAMREIRRRLHLAEKLAGPVDWENLDEWIQKAEKACQRDLEAKFQVADAFGINMVDLTSVQSIDTAIKGTTLWRFIEYEWGPQWRLRLKELDSIRPDDSWADAGGIPMDVFTKKILEYADRIMNQWNILRRADLDQFVERWRNLTLSTRTTWLARNHPHLPTRSDSDVYAWTQNSKIDNSLFMAPLLNIEDLSHGDVLPRLLRVRQSLHPALFRSIDGECVYLGIWSGGLKQLKVNGRMSFMLGSALKGFESYGIFTHGNSESDRLHCVDGGNEVRPIIGLHQLKAQSATYAFLTSCLRYSLDSPTLVGEINDPSCARPLGLLGQYAQESFGRSPDSIDTEYLDSVLEASLNEALDDLWQLRENVDAWYLRMKEIPGSPPGKLSNFLRSTFGRIDTFHTLHHHLHSATHESWFQAQDGPMTTSQPQARHAFERLVSLHVAFRCMLNELLSQMKQIKWFPKNCTSAPFSTLYQLLKTNDPCLRVVGIPTVLRIIDREILTVEEQGRIPFPVMRALNDMSVLAACLQETSKHCDFVGSNSHYVNLVNELVIKWDGRQRPWVLVAESTLDMLERNKTLQLSTLIRERSDTSHYRFWSFIDRCMEACRNSSTSAVIDTIQRTAPIHAIPATPLNSITPLGPSTYQWHDPVQPTRTQVRRSRRQATISTPVTACKAPPPLQLQSTGLPIIEPTQDIDFWTHLLAPSSEYRSELHWDDFCAAMENIGFTIIKQGGSGRQFKGKLGLIVFHEPQPRKVPHKVARSWWLRRISKRFSVRLKD